jgi:hypothetical protein
MLCKGKQDLDRTGSTTVAVSFKLRTRAVTVIVAQLMVVIALRAWSWTSRAAYYQKDILLTKRVEPQEEDKVVSSIVAHQ